MPTKKNDTAMSAVIHGLMGIGKSTFASTLPGPRLVLDAEMTGSAYTPVHKLYWDPLEDPLPEGITDDTSVIVPITSWEQAEACMTYLHSPDHPFRSLVVDTLTEVQSALKQEISGMNEGDEYGHMRERDWGALLNQMERFCKRARNLATPNNKPRPVNICILALSDDLMSPMKPIVQGRAGKLLPAWYDLFGYYYVQRTPDSGELNRYLCLVPNEVAQAKCRIPEIAESENGVYANPTWSTLLNVIN